MSRLSHTVEEGVRCPPPAALNTPGSKPDGDIGLHLAAADSPGSEIAYPRPHFARVLFRLPSAALLLLIRIYQITLSPALPVITLGRCGCRFSPSCSHYAATAIRTHGFWRGTGLAAVRLVKCTPLHPGGFDPVPPHRASPRCTRLAA